MADAPVWVLDTNVVVWGLLSPAGPPGRLVDVLVGRRLRLATDDRIEQEYREVLARTLLGIEPIRREAFLAILQFQEHVTALPWRTERRRTRTTSCSRRSRSRRPRTRSSPGTCGTSRPDTAGR